MLHNMRTRKNPAILAVGASVFIILLVLSVAAGMADCTNDPNLYFPVPGTTFGDGEWVQAVTSPVCQGGTIIIKVTVGNSSCGASSPFYLNVYYDQYDAAHLIDTLYVDGLDGCNYVMHQFMWDTTGVSLGTHTILAWADPDNDVPELNEDDNQYEMPFAATINPYAPLIEATKTYSDVNGGDVNPDDTIDYTIVIRNDGCADQANNPGDEFVDSLPAGVTATGAVSASTGSIVLDGQTVRWNGEIPASGTVTITIVAKIDSDAVDGQEICNQGHVNWDSDGNATNDADEPTDDPSTPTDDDPTCLIVSVPTDPAVVGTIDAPTLSEWAQILLAILIGSSFAVMVVRRRRVEG